jgi:hypothetical protein
MPELAPVTMATFPDNNEEAEEAGVVMTVYLWVKSPVRRKCRARLFFGC